MKIYKKGLILSFAFISSCGVKGSPQPPQIDLPPTISYMNLKQQGDLLVLYWKYDKTKKIRQKVYINGKAINIKINHYNDYYWIDYKYPKINKEYCFYIKTTYKKFEKNSIIKCIKTTSYTKIKDKINVKIIENGILLKWNNKYNITNIYKGDSYSEIIPIPYEQIKNQNYFIDNKVNLNKIYCYYITATINGIESNRIYSKCIKFKDFFPPKPPINLTYIVKNKKLIIIWQPPEDKDLEGFLILKNGKPIFNAVIKSYYVEIKNYKKGDIFAIISVDKAGNKSKPAYLKIE